MLRSVMKVSDLVVDRRFGVVFVFVFVLGHLADRSPQVKAVLLCKKVSVVYSMNIG